MPNALDALHRLTAFQEEEEADNAIIPVNLPKDYTEFLNPRPQMNVIPQDSIGEYNNIIQQPEKNTPRTSLGVQYTLNDLEKDPEFQTRTDRFMEEIGRDEDIFEYLRDSDYSLSSAIARSFEIKDWSEQAKQDYVYLRETFDKASLGGLGQTVNMVKDLAVDFILDPINWAALATGGAAFGATQAGKELIKIGTKEALKKTQKAALNKELLKQAKKGVLYGSLEGGAWAGSHDYFLQKGDVELGLRDDIDATQTAIVTAIGGSLGGILGTSIGLMTSTSPLLAAKLRRFSNEDVIEQTVKNKGKTPKDRQKTLKEDVQADDDIIEMKDTTVWLPKWLKGISESFGKTTTQFQKVGKEFKKIGDHLHKYRYDALKTITDPEGGVRIGPWTFGESMISKKGLWTTNFLRAIQPLPRTGKKKIWGKVRDTFWVQRLTKKHDAQLFHLIQNRDTKLWRSRTMPSNYPAYSDSIISDRTREAARQTSDIFQAIWEESARMPNHKWIGPRGKRKQIIDKSLDEDFFEPIMDPNRRPTANYFPWKYSHEKIAKDPEGFVRRVLVESGWEVKDPVTGDITIIPYAAPNDTVSSKMAMSIIDDEGKLIHGYKTDPKGKQAPLSVDQVAFGRSFYQEAAEELGDDATEEAIFELATWTKGRAMRDRLLSLKNEPRRIWEVNEAINDMLEPFNVKKEKTRGAGRTGWLGERMWENVGDDVMYDYVDTNVEEVVSDYINNAALLVTREQIFGKSVEIYASRYLTPIMKELEDGGVSAKERMEIERRLIKNYRRITGVEIPAPWGDDPKGRIRFGTDVMKTIQTLAHLPMATVSSLTEPLILLSRVRGKDAPKSAIDVVSAMVKESRKTKQKIINAGKRAFGKEHVGLDDVLDETWQEAYQVGLALEQAVQDRMEGLYGEMIDTRLQKISRGFFKTTLLTQWTAAVQLAAFTSGKRLIRQNLKELSDGVDTFGRPLSKIRKERLTGELEELNIDVKRGVKFYKDSLDEKGNFDSISAKRKGFYENDFIRGANRFSREIILVPDITEANKPLWFSHPVGQMFAQFASYPTAFNNTILKRFAYETTRDIKGMKQGAMPVSTPKIVATTMLMTSVATLTNIARSRGTSLEKPPGIIAVDAIERWGGLGPTQHAYRFWENAKYGSGPLAAAGKSVAGPFVQDVVDTFLYRRGIFENIAANVPFYQLGTAITPDAMKGLKKAGRDIDKVLFAPFTRDIKVPKVPKPKSLTLYKSPYSLAKGGVVNNVAQVKEEPDERIDRMTGLPYHIQAGVLGQDEEDRAAFAEGGGVSDEAIKEVYSLVSKDIRKLAPIFRDSEEIDIYSEEEAKRYAKGITEPIYRIMKDNTSQQDAEDLRDSEELGVHLSTDMPSTKTNMILKGYVNLIRPLNLAGMDVPLEGYKFVEELQNNPDLKNKIIEDSILPNPTAKEHVDDLVFYHYLNKEASKNHIDLPHMKSLLNIVASHKVREVFKDIGYDGIIYQGEDSDVVDKQVEELEREQKFAGGIISKLARRAASKRKTKKVVVFDKDKAKYVQQELDLESLTDKVNIKRNKMKEDSKTLYVYADNETRGEVPDVVGSSANIARGLDNSIGIVTKRLPSGGAKAFWNDYKVTRKGKEPTINSKSIQRHKQKMNDDITAVMKKFVLGDYDNIIFSEDLTNFVDFNRQQVNLTRPTFKKKLTALRIYTRDFKDNGKLLGESKVLDREKILDRDVALVYEKKWTPPDQIIDPVGKTPIQKSKLGIDTPMDKPRGASAKDLGVPEDQALYSPGHPESIKRKMAYDDQDELMFIKIQDAEINDPSKAEEMWDEYLFEKYPELFRTKKSVGGLIKVLEKRNGF